MKHSYSPGEKKMLALLKSKPQTSIALAEKFYDKQRPYYDRQVVVGLLSNLASKAKRNGEPFVIQRTKRAGPKPISFWIEK